MDQAAFVPVFKFRTIDYPEQDRFHVWVRTCCATTVWMTTAATARSTRKRAARRSALILSGRQWRSRAPAYRVNRTTRRIRLDGRIRSASHCCSAGGWPATRRAELVKRAGDVFVYDVAQVNDCRVEAGDVISLVVPRYLLPSHAAWKRTADADERRGAAGDHAVAVPQPADSAHARDPEHRAIDVAAAGRGHFTHHAGAATHAARSTGRWPSGSGATSAHLLGSTSIPTGSAATSACRERGSTSCSGRRRRDAADHAPAAAPCVPRAGRPAAPASAHRGNRVGARLSDESISTGCSRRSSATPKETLECATAPVLLPCDAAEDRWADGGRLTGWTLPFGVLTN